MAKYDNTKFYWLQLKEDFFDEDAIDWLEEQPNGKEYSLFYLKLCLKSLRTNGVLIRRVGNMLVPYDHTKLGELTKTNPDTVMVAMNLLINIGLVQKLENGELYLTQVENMIGSQSKGAFKKQQQRLTKQIEVPQIESGQAEDNCPPDIEKEKEIDLEIDLEEEKEVKKKKSASATYLRTAEGDYLGSYKNIKLKETELAKLNEEYGIEETQEAIDHLSEYIELKGYKAKSHYLALRKWVYTAVKEERIKKLELEQREKRAQEIHKKQALNELKEFYEGGSFDTDSFYEAAVKKSLGDAYNGDNGESLFEE